jgi:hypothetical protein
MSSFGIMETLIIHYYLYLVLKYTSNFEIMETEII